MNKAKKHAQRSMRSYNEKKYAFAGFNQFEKRINHTGSNDKNPLKLAMLVSKLMNGFKAKKTKKKAGK